MERCKSKSKKKKKHNKIYADPVFPWRLALKDGEDGGVAEPSRRTPADEGGEVEGRPTPSETESSASAGKKNGQSVREVKKDHVNIGQIEKGDIF